MDRAVLGALFGRVQAAIQAGDWDRGASLAADYAGAPDFNAHVGGALAEMLLPHDSLLTAAAQLVEQAVARNTLENLAMIGPTNATPGKQRMDFAWFHSMQALIYFKTGRLVRADSAMVLAQSYMTGGVEAQAVDLVRAGLIGHALGRTDAWMLLQKGLLLDSAVEHVDPAYVPAIAAVVAARQRRSVEVGAYLAALRRRQAQPVPDLRLAAVDGAVFGLAQKKGKVLFLNFFSPLCSTCQQQVPAVKSLYQAYRGDGEVEFLFILNNPGLLLQTQCFMEGIGLAEAALVILTQDSAFDHIPGEPTVWIVDRQGRLSARHTGYRSGDAELYEAGLVDARASAPSTD
ncbi:MAG: redoxin family protein [Candidatus Latescibacteria bacterium]|nr:redoxin family protein [Candidatus Latescibacterota bacterium]